MNDIFSKREMLILKSLGRKRMTLEQISNEIFKTGDKPIDDRVTIGNSIRRINVKCTRNNLDWYLRKSRTNNKLTIKKERIL